MAPRNRRGNGNQRSGRIHPSQCNTDNETPILGQDIAIQNRHNDAIISTEKSSMTDKCRKDYRGRIKEMIEWIRVNYRRYYSTGTKLLTAEEKADKVLFHHNNDRDLVYSGLNVEIIKAFLSVKKVRARTDDGEIKLLHSFSHIRKYDDAIKWAAGLAKSLLSEKYYTEMDKFINAYRKEFQAAKKEGKVEERDADPITVTLYRMILKWAVAEGNIFVWVFTLAMLTNRSSWS